jgi:hypothetical protein
MKPPRPETDVKWDIKKTLTLLQSAMKWEERISLIFCSLNFPELIECSFAGFSHQNLTEIYAIRYNFVILKRTKRIYQKFHMGIIKRKISFWVQIRVRFFAAFSTDSKSASNSAFFDNHIAFLEFLFYHICTFYKLCRQMRTKRLKKTEKLFLKCVSELNFATLNGLGDPSC